MRLITMIATLLALVGLGAFVLVGWAVVISLPGMQRYLKIRRM